MSKGNMFLGYARGKVGSLVFARRKGEQITRARNFAPANPRTTAQMSQRMKMYAPVQLYRQSMRRFFKYAFIQKAQETVFNAYMRENIGVAPWVSKQLSVDQAPVPFPARMSSGGLVSVATSVAGLTSLQANQLASVIAQQGDSVVLALKSSVASANATIGAVSAALLAANPELQAGDQLTFVLCKTSGISLLNGDVVYNGLEPFGFRYAKINLNPDDDRQLSAIGLSVVAEVGGQSVIGMSIGGSLTDDAIGGCIIVTRISGTTVLASNSVLVLNAYAQRIYDFMRSEAYKIRASKTYGGTEDAYLKPDGVAVSGSDSSTPETPDTPDNPDEGDDPEEPGTGGGGEGDIFIGTSVNNTAWGSVTGTGNYAQGAEVTLTAVPAEGYRFAKWTDDNTDNPRIVIAEVSGVVYTAVFEEGV